MGMVDTFWLGWASDASSSGMERKNKDHVFKITENLKKSSFIFSYFQLFLNDMYFLIIITKINIHCKISFESIEKYKEQNGYQP